MFSFAGSGQPRTSAPARRVKNFGASWLKLAQVASPADRMHAAQTKAMNGKLTVYRDPFVALPKKRRQAGMACRFNHLS
jgi:hypothetical protein